MPDSRSLAVQAPQPRLAVGVRHEGGVGHRRLRPTQTWLPGRRKRDRYNRAEVIVAFACLAPALAVIGAFVAYPIVATGYMSLTSWNGATPFKHFIGLANYDRLVHDAAFRNAMTVTVLYGLGVVVLSVVTGLGAALLLNGKLRLRGFYRGVFFLPVVTSSIAAASVWRYLFDGDGVVNAVLAAVGLGSPNWLGDPHLALVSLTLLTVWKQLGLNTVLYLTALQAIPQTMYEAAALDGAGVWARVRRITFPLLAPMTFFVVIEALVTTFQTFDLVYALTKGGPLGGTDVLGFFVYSTAFGTGQFGYAASAAYAGFALVFAITWIQWRVGGRSRWGAA